MLDLTSLKCFIQIIKSFLQFYCLRRTWVTINKETNKFVLRKLKKWISNYNCNNRCASSLTPPASPLRSQAQKPKSASLSLFLLADAPKKRSVYPSRISHLSRTLSELSRTQCRRSYGATQPPSFVREKRVVGRLVRGAGIAPAGSATAHNSYARGGRGRRRRRSSPRNRLHERVTFRCSLHYAAEEVEGGVTVVASVRWIWGRWERGIKILFGALCWYKCRTMSSLCWPVSVVA